MREDDLLQGTGYRVQLGSLALVADRLDGPETGVPKTARILHEYDHLVRLLGTPYGLIRHGFLSQYLHYFLRSFDRMEGLDEFRIMWRDVKSGAGSRMTDAALEAAYFGDAARSDLYRAQCSQEAIAMLDGRGLSEIGIGGLAGWAEYCSCAAGEASPRSDTLRMQLEKLWGGAVPQGTSSIHLDGKPVTVPDILEYLGVVVETAYQVQFGEGPTEFPEDLPAKTYLQILNVVKEYIPAALDPSTGRMAQEIEAILELVLWIPLWPEIEPGQLPVHGVHLIPSYRLQAILDACQALDLPYSFGDENSDVEQISPRAAEFHRAICAYLKWPTPEQIARRWREGLDKIEADGKESWSKLYFHHPRSRRLAWSRQLIVECGDHPVSSAMLAGSRHYGKIGFPTIFDLSNGQAGYVPNGDIEWPIEDREFQRMDALLFTASSYAPRRVDWNYLPQPVQDEAVETWRRTPHAR